MSDAMDDAFADEEDEVAPTLPLASRPVHSSEHASPLCLELRPLSPTRPLLQSPLRQDEEENVLGSVLAEMGVELGNQFQDTPSATAATRDAVDADPGSGQVASASGGDDTADIDAELQKRLDNLRRT